MLKQMTTLTSCLSDLKSSSLPTIERLKLEVALVQTMWLLLDQKVERKLSGNEASEAEFDHINNLVRQVCGAGGGVEGIFLSLKSIQDSLKSIISGSTVSKDRIRRLMRKNIFKLRGC